MLAEQEENQMSDILNQAVFNRRSRDEEPDWFNLEIWGKQAQIAADYVKKGSLIGITGSFKIDSWKDKNTGEDRYKPVVRVDRVTQVKFLSKLYFLSKNLISIFIKKYKKIKIKTGFITYLI